MIQQTVNKLVILALKDGLATFLYFPLWWYTKGFLKALKAAWNFVIDLDLTLGFSIWLKNIFTPIFGQRDIMGRIISFFLRLFQIIVRGFVMLIVTIMAIVFLIIWLILPVFTFYQIFIHFFNV